jgi:hypothetical protein
MVSMDRPPDRHSTHAELPAGIDPIAVQQMFGHDLGLFKLMLLRVLLLGSVPLAQSGHPGGNSTTRQ